MTQDERIAALEARILTLEQLAHKHGYEDQILDYDFMVRKGVFTKPQPDETPDPPTTPALSLKHG